MLRVSALLFVSAVVVTLATRPAGSPLFTSHNIAGTRAADTLELDSLPRTEIEMAIRSLRQAIRANPNAAQYHFDLAFLYGNDPEAAMKATGLSRPDLYREMLRESRKAVALEPEDIEIALSYANNFLLAEAFGARPDWNHAVSAWEHCLALRTTEFENHQNSYNNRHRYHCLVQLARVEIRAGLLAEARAHLETARGIMQRSPFLQDLLVACAPDRDGHASPVSRTAPFSSMAAGGPRAGQAEDAILPVRVVS